MQDLKALKNVVKSILVALSKSISNQINHFDYFNLYLQVSIVSLQVESHHFNLAIVQYG